MNGFQACTYFAAMLWAAVFGIRGWITSRPDSTARMRDRFLTDGGLFVGMLILSVTYIDRHQWGWLIAVAVGVVGSYTSATKWYRLWEKRRQFEYRYGVRRG